MGGLPTESTRRGKATRDATSAHLFLNGPSLGPNRKRFGRIVANSVSTRLRIVERLKHGVPCGSTSVFCQLVASLPWRQSSWLPRSQHVPTLLRRRRSNRLRLAKTPSVCRRTKTASSSSRKSPMRLADVATALSFTSGDEQSRQPMERREGNCPELSMMPLSKRGAEGPTTCSWSLCRRWPTERSRYVLPEFARTNKQIVTMKARENT